MKAHQFGIVFVVITLVFMLIADMKTMSAKVITEESERIDQNLSNAIDAAVSHLVVTDTVRTTFLARKQCMETFYQTLYASFGALSDVVLQQRLQLYIPVVLITDRNGVYAYYKHKYENNGIIQMKQDFSECIPYTYEDEHFVICFTMGDEIKIFDKQGILRESANQSFNQFKVDADSEQIVEEKSCFYELNYHELQTEPRYALFRTKLPNYFLLDEQQFLLVRNSTMIDMINRTMKYYLNQHNDIAKSYGISYEFSLPVMDESEMMRSIENPGMILVFQGYPISFDGTTYNQVEVAGAQIYKKEKYVIEKKGWYKVYHHMDCVECENNPNIDFTKQYDSIEQCVEEGAYGCEICTNGVPVPEYDLGDMKE